MGDVKLEEAFEKPSHLPLSTVVAAISGFVYVSGYLVHSFFIRSKGIPTLPLLNAEYIHVGLVFLCLTGFVVAVPCSLWWAVVEGRKRSHSRFDWSIWITPFVATNYLYLILFFALFITRPDWELRVVFFGVDFALGTISLAYFTLVAILLLIVPSIRHYRGHYKPSGSVLSNGIDRTNHLKIIGVIVRTLQLCSVSLTLTFDAVLLLRLPWFLPFLARLVPLAVLLTIATIAVRIIWAWGDVYRLKGIRNVFALSSLPFFIAFYLILISTYTYGVYKSLPVNRGGRYPLEAVMITLSADSEAAGLEKLVGGDGSVVTQPMFIMEDSGDFLYLLPVSDSKEWFRDTSPFIGIRKSSVLRLDFVSTDDGEPRM